MNSENVQRPFTLFTVAERMDTENMNCHFSKHAKA